MLKKLTMVIAVLLVSSPCFGAERINSTPDTAIIWREPIDIETRDLFYGPGGKAHQPLGPFRFIEEDKDGSNPKFTIEGSDGVQWKVKLGEEVRSETAASRLLWAVGYFTDEDYFAPRLSVESMPRLKRGQKFVDSDGLIRNARLERQPKREEKIGNWRWREAPSSERAWNGLRVMMALLNNWDLKDVNNAVYSNTRDTGAKRTFVVSDLGATFGTPGFSFPMSKAKDNLATYSSSKFITRVTPEYVNFSTPSRPALIRLYDPLFISRLRMRWIGKRIPLADAKWIGGLLGRLSTQQIGDAFRASGYTPGEVDGFTRAVQERIAALKGL